MKPRAVLNLRVYQSDISSPDKLYASLEERDRSIKHYLFTSKSVEKRIQFWADKNFGSSEVNNATAKSNITEANGACFSKYWK